MPHQTNIQQFKALTAAQNGSKLLETHPFPFLSQVLDGFIVRPLARHAPPEKPGHCGGLCLLLAVPGGTIRGAAFQVARGDHSNYSNWWLEVKPKK